MQVIKKIKVLSEDTFFRGAFCGAVAGVIKDIIDFIIGILNFDKRFFWTFASVVDFGELPKGPFMNIMGVLLEIIFSAFLGVLFALIAHKIKTRHYLLIGTLYGSIVWFFIRAAIVAYKINE